MQAPPPIHRLNVVMRLALIQQAGYMEYANMETNVGSDFDVNAETVPFVARYGRSS